MYTGSQVTSRWKSGWSARSVTVFVVELSLLMTAEKHQSKDRFPSFKSERLITPLVAPPLMEDTAINPEMHHNKRHPGHTEHDMFAWRQTRTDRRSATDSDGISLLGINFGGKIVLH